MRITIDSFFLRDPALLARILLLGSALLAAYYSFSLQIPGLCWERVNHLSIFGFLPERYLASSALFNITRVVCITTLGLWLLHRALPWAPIIATLSYTFLVAQHIEMSFYTEHMYHFVNNTLIVLCAWYCFDRKNLKSIRPGDNYFNGTVPRWVFLTLLGYIVIAYTQSGITKLIFSGSNWFDGSALQLWVVTYSSANNPITRLLIENRTFATFSQLTALFCEATIALGLFFPRLLPLYGLGLCGFHIMVELIFGLGFYGNIFIDFIVLLAYPIYLQRINRE